MVDAARISIQQKYKFPIIFLEIVHGITACPKTSSKAMNCPSRLILLLPYDTVHHDHTTTHFVRMTKHRRIRSVCLCATTTRLRSLNNSKHDHFAARALKAGRDDAQVNGETRPDRQTDRQTDRREQTRADQGRLTRPRCHISPRSDTLVTHDELISPRYGHIYLRSHKTAGLGGFVVKSRPLWPKVEQRLHTCVTWYLGSPFVLFCNVQIMAMLAAIFRPVLDFSITDHPCIECICTAYMLRIARDGPCHCTPVIAFFRLHYANRHVSAPTPDILLSDVILCGMSGRQADTPPSFCTSSHDVLLTPDTDTEI